MNTEMVIATVAVLIALASAVFTGVSVKHARRSADAAEAQVAGMRETNISASQPYVWADVQLNEATGTLIDVVVGNSGPTVAQNVRVLFEPPLPVGSIHGDDLTRRALARLEGGLDSLAPGRTLRWTLGKGSELLAVEHSQVHAVTIDAEGPFGQVPRLAYDIDLSDFRETEDEPQGTLHRLTRAVEGVTAELKKRP